MVKRCTTVHLNLCLALRPLCSADAHLLQWLSHDARQAATDTLLPPAGAEPSSKSLGKPQGAGANVCNSGAIQREAGAFATDLAEVVRAWPGLPAVTRANIVKAVRAWLHDGKATSGDGSDSKASEAGKAQMVR